MIWQHDAARADADGAGRMAGFSNDQRGGSTGNVLHAVVFGEPEAGEPGVLSAFGHHRSCGQRVTDSAAFDNGAQIEN